MATNFIQQHSIVAKGNHFTCQACPLLIPELIHDSDVVSNVIPFAKRGDVWHRILHKNLVSITLLV